MTTPPDELVSRYRAAARPEPPRDLDRRVLQIARGRPEAWSARPLAFAAAAVLSLGVVLAIEHRPPSHAAPAARATRSAVRAEFSATPSDSRQTRLYSTDPPLRRDARTWLADIAGLRRAGRNADADAETARFRRAYPNDDRDAEH